MDDLLKSMAHDLRRRVVRALIDEPALQHKQLLKRLDIAHAARGTLTKAIAPLEEAGVLERVGSGDDEKYVVTNSAAASELLRAATVLHASAAQALVRRATRAADAAQREVELLDEEPGES